MSTLASKATTRSRAPSKPDRSAAPPAPVESPGAPDVLLQLKTTLVAATSALERLRNGCMTLTTELTPLAPPQEDTAQEVTDPEELQNALFEQVKQAVLQADAAIDKFCFKRRPATAQAESKKAVTAALEQMADEIWRAVAEGSEKPVTVQLSSSLSAFAQVTPQLETMKQSLADALQQADTLIAESKEGAAARDELANELAGEGQRMLSSFTRFTSSKKTDKSSLPVVRQEMETILTDMTAAVQTPHRGSEEAEGCRLKKEVARIRQKVQTLCKALEDAESPESGSTRSKRPMSMASDELEQLTEQSEKSSVRPLSAASGFSIDTEEIKAELARRLSESESHMLSAISEQRDGFTTMHQSQANLQKKQEELVQEIAEIKRRLSEMSTGGQAGSREKSQEVAPRELSVLKTLAPDIRANSDPEFVKKFAKLFSTQQREVENFLASVRTEDTSFRSLAEVTTEIHKLRSANTSLQEQNEEALIKMIRSQSEFEIEIEFQKMKVAALEQEIATLKENTVNAQDMAELRTKLEELTQENSRLKGDAFDVSSVEPTEPEVDYSKNDELAYLKLQLHERKQKLIRLLDERKHLESRIASQTATPAETQAYSVNQQKCDFETAEMKRLMRQIQSEEDSPENLQTRELEMRSVDEKLGKQIMALLNLREACEICGMVMYDEDQWVLVRVESGYVWVNTSLDRYKLSDEGLIMECVQALEILETDPHLPRSLVLALGYLMSQARIT